MVEQGLNVFQDADVHAAAKLHRAGLTPAQIRTLRTTAGLSTTMWLTRQRTLNKAVRTWGAEAVTAVLHAGATDGFVNVPPPVAIAYAHAGQRSPEPLWKYAQRHRIPTDTLLAWITAGYPMLGWDREPREHWPLYVTYTTAAGPLGLSALLAGWEADQVAAAITARGYDHVAAELELHHATH